MEHSAAAFANHSIVPLGLRLFVFSGADVDINIQCVLQIVLERCEFSVAVDGCNVESSGIVSSENCVEGFRQGLIVSTLFAFEFGAITGFDSVINCSIGNRSR